MAKNYKKLTLEQMPAPPTEDKLEKRVLQIAAEYFKTVERRFMLSMKCDCENFRPAQFIGKRQIRRDYAVFEYRICWRCKCGLYCSRAINVCHLTLIYKQ